MKTVKIKVCGMRFPENIKEVLNAKPNFMGFIFYKDSKRYVDAIPVSIPETVNKVGVFVNESTDFIERIASKNGIEFIQLHGDESVETCGLLKNKGFKIIKAFQVESELPIQELKQYEEVCDYFLLDTKSNTYGGTGKTFDWSCLETYNLSTPIILSGGISMESTEKIKELLKTNIPIEILDINSRFEKDIAKKDAQLIEEFIQNIRK